MSKGLETGVPAKKKKFDNHPNEQVGDSACVEKQSKLSEFDSW